MAACYPECDQVPTGIEASDIRMREAEEAIAAFHAQAASSAVPSVNLQSSRLTRGQLNDSIFLCPTHGLILRVWN